MTELLGLTQRPVAVGFFAEPPTGLHRWAGGRVAAGCQFWRHVQAGHAFYTVLTDHLNCTVGCEVLGWALPEPRRLELERTADFMARRRYMLPVEVAAAPRLRGSPGCVAYAPADDPRFDPDVVLLALAPRQAMVARAAVVRCGAGDAGMPTVGGPACGVLAEVGNRGRAALSLGCMGSRTLADLSPDHQYVALLGPVWPRFAAALPEVVAAHRSVESFYLLRAELFAEGCACCPR